MQRVAVWLKKVLPLLKNVRVWVPVVCVVITACLADGVINSTGKLHTFAVTFLDIAGRLGLWSATTVASVGVLVAANWQQERKPLEKMTDAEREEIFKAHPEARASWEKRKLAMTPPPLPPPPSAGDVLDGKDK